MLGLGIDGWTNVMIASLGVAAVAASLSWLSTFVISRLQKQEAAAAVESFERYKAGVAGEVAEAQKRGIEAGRAASDALLRAAELEKDAAEARLESEKIKAAVAWRAVSPESAAKMEQVLLKQPGWINLRYIDGDPEALYLATQFSNIFAKAHWQVAPGAIKPANTAVFGILIPPATGAVAEALVKALTGAGIPVTRGNVPQVGVSFSVATIQDAPTLIIGSRVPAVPWVKP